MSALLDYLRTQPGRCSGCGWHLVTQGCNCGDEWAVFTAALRTAGARDGLVHQRDMRPRLRAARIHPKHVGTMYRRAKAEGLIRDTGGREPSNDAAGRNLDKLDRIYALLPVGTPRPAPSAPVEVERVGVTGP
jgi:hypothetical protein